MQITNYSLFKLFNLNLYKIFPKGLVETEFLTSLYPHDPEKAKSILSSIKPLQVIKTKLFEIHSIFLKALTKLIF